MTDETPDSKTQPPAVKVHKPAKKAAGGIAATDVRRKRQVALGAVLAPLMEPALARQGVLLAQIAPHWRALCPLLADHSCPESVKGDTLTVAVASDGVKQELHYVTPQVIEGINRLLGYSAIAKVRGITRHDVRLRTGSAAVRHMAKPAAPITGPGRDKAEGMCKSVRDDDLRAALAALGAEILNKPTNKKG
ncbi:MAG: DUF721 domain-containing protein [Rubrivivax sp.]|nr:MAG: DUF721 domain-containing protein [Rubrivivax sp.]